MTTCRCAYRLIWILAWNSLFAIPAMAQSPEVSYARFIIDTLCSAEMNGRGYVDDGDHKAAAFIESELKKLGLLPISGNYRQPFRISVNTFPGKMEVSLNGKKRIPGKDFLVDPSCSCRKGTYKLTTVAIDSLDVAEAETNKTMDPLQIAATATSTQSIAFHKESFRKSDYSRWRQVILEKSSDQRIVAEFTSGKLTHAVSPDADLPCYIKVQADSLPAGPLRMKLHIENKLETDYETHNVVAYVPGSHMPDSFLVFTAHYDHLGQMGDGTYFPGANDNASGVSMLLNLARYYSRHPAEYSVAFIFFSAEELGLEGSKWFTEHPLIPLDKIRFLVNLDIAGTGDDGIKVVNATEFPQEFDRLVALNNSGSLLKQVAPRGKAANSDHYPFYLKGVRCFFIYTLGGIAAYHDVYDRAHTLPLTDYKDLYTLMIHFGNTLMQHDKQ